MAATSPTQKTIALGGRTLAEVVETARHETGQTLVVAYGVAGASSTGWTSFAAEEGALRRYLAHARSVTAGRAGQQVVYGAHGLVMAHYVGDR